MMGLIGTHLRKIGAPLVHGRDLLKSGHSTGTQRVHDCHRLMYTYAPLAGAAAEQAEERGKELVRLNDLEGA
jgi:hypothetical protein